MSTLTNIVTALRSAGVTPAMIPIVVQTLAANSPVSAIQAACSAILANSNNPAVVKDEATKMAEIPNLPVAVANLLPELTAATTPLQVVAAVQAIETAIGPATGGLGLNLGALGAAL